MKFIIIVSLYVVAGISCSNTNFEGGTASDKTLKKVDNSPHYDENGNRVDEDGNRIDDNGNIIDEGTDEGTDEGVESEDDLSFEDDSFEVPGTPVRLVGVGFAAGNHDDWNDGAVCFEATEQNISIDDRKIRVNKDVKVKIQLSGHSYPGPTVEVLRIKRDGTEEQLANQTFIYNKNAPGKFEIELEFKKGDEIYSKVTSGSTTYEQNSAEWSRITPNNCDDSPDN